eukprot:657358-Pleurochrysis_carterae.AAC.1
MAPGIGLHDYESLTYDVRVSDFLQAVEWSWTGLEEYQSCPLAARQLRRGRLGKEVQKKSLEADSVELGEANSVAAGCLQARYVAVKLGKADPKRATLKHAQGKIAFDQKPIA